MTHIYENDDFAKENVSKVVTLLWNLLSKFNQKF